LAIGAATGCERDGATSAPSAPSGPEATAPAGSASDPAAVAPTAAGPAAPDPVEPEPAAPEPVPAKPADPTQVERVLADYHRIERFLRPQPEGAELSAADRKLLRGYLGEKRFAWYETDGGSDTVRQAWLERMSEQAGREPPSTIRMPLYTNVGWGCEVPSIWVATGNFDPDVTFILPVGDTALIERCERCYDVEDEERRGDCITRRCELQVQGHFTGKITEPTAHCESAGHELHIERATAQGSSPAPFFLALPGGAAPADGPPLADGPRWGVLFTNAFRHETNARERADALRARLVEKGHASAQVLDSRRVPTLWCCSFVVLVERFDDEKAARTLAKRLGREGFDGALVRQLY
jgi:hypothetical protein